MKYITLASLIMLFCIANHSTTISAQIIRGGARPDYTCPRCDPGGGGGGGGGTSSAGLSWGTFSAGNFSAGGTRGRQGVSTAIANGIVYVAYTGSNIVDSKGDAPIYLTTTTGAGNSISPGTQISLNTGAQQILALSNPALASDGTNLYLGWVDGYGNFAAAKGTYVGAGVYNWGSGLFGLYTGANDAAEVIYSPSMAFNGSTNTLYISLVNGADRSLSLGQASISLSSPSAPAVTWTNFPNNTNIGMSPGIGIFNNQLYIGFPAYDNSHNLYYWTTPDGYNLTYHTGSAGDSSSTTPSFAVHNGYLYVGFRTNDGDHKFEWKYSSDGLNWSTNTSLSGSIAGPPSLIDGTPAGIPHLIDVELVDNSNYISASETTN